MASGDGTNDGLGREENTRTKSLGKTTHENKMSATLELQSDPEKNQSPEILSTLNVAQDLTLLKGKQALWDSKYGHDNIDQSKQSSTSWTIDSFRDGPGIFPSSNEERIIALGPSSSSKKRIIQALQELDSQIDCSNLAQSNLQGVATSVAPVGSNVVETNVGIVVALLGEASLELNGGPLVLNDIGHVEPSVEPIVVLQGVAPTQSNVALIVTLPDEDLAQPNIATNVALLAPAIVASSIVPGHVAPLQLDVAPLAPAQPNAALILVPPNEALAQPIIAAIVAPPAVVILHVNHGLNRSRLKPLRICEIGLEGHFWPKLPQS